MKQRDQWKQTAVNLAAANGGNCASLEERVAWANFKKYRNKVNNRKKNEEFMFKKQCVERNLGDTATMWNTAKSFMDWKVAGSPTQIQSGNILYQRCAEN